MLGLLLHIITYHCTLLQTWGFQLDFVAERDVGTLYIYRLFLAITILTAIVHRSFNQWPSVPDVVWAPDIADKQFYPGWTNEDEVLLGPALHSLVSLMYHMHNMQCPVCWCVPLPWQLGCWINLLYSWRRMLIKCCCAGLCICLFRRFIVRPWYFFRHFRCACPYSCESTHQNCVKICGCKLLLLRIITYMRSILLRISAWVILCNNDVIMCNNDVIIVLHYSHYRPCTRCRQKLIISHAWWWIFGGGL